MHKILLCLMFSCYALGDLVLQKEYRFSGEVVYAKDLFAEIPKNFLVLKIPKSSNSYQVKGNQIVEIFESEGIFIKLESPIITFKRALSGEQRGIESYILAEFLREYQKNNIHIQAVILEQVTPVEFKEDAVQFINFSPKLLKRSTGSFDVVVQEKSNGQTRNRKVYFRYFIDARLQAVQTNASINGGESVQYNNVKIIWIPFTRISSPLMQAHEIGNVAVRSYTPKDVIITQDRLIPKRVVKRGDIIVVSVVEDGVLLEFSLEAQKDAAVGDIIKARAIGNEKIQNKKIYEVEILSENRGKLL